MVGIPHFLCVSKRNPRMPHQPRPQNPSEPEVYFIRQAHPGLPGLPGEYLVHTPNEPIDWTAQRPVHAPDPDALANPAVVTRLR